MARKTKRGKSPGRPKTAPPRVMVSLRFPEELYERVQNACYERRVVLTTLLVRHMEDWVRQQETRHHDGEPFPPRPRD